MQALEKNPRAGTQEVPDFPTNNAMSDFASELCGDCLTPAKWSTRFKRWTCDRCGA